MVNPVAVARVEILDEHFPHCVEPYEPVVYAARYLAVLAGKVIIETGKNPIPANMQDIKASMQDIKGIFGDDTEAWDELIGPCLRDEELCVRAANVAEILAESERSIHG
ncbi:TPA: hypothetical protein EYO12_00905 [Candidatus Saccharibacteria bacterium]|nr:hypothetical protein [Candidatus Saccharibacteria bacterium]HIO87277.1 hypothetical protein [Candidatus Saccharibacteria bacterium]